MLETRIPSAHHRAPQNMELAALGAILGESLQRGERIPEQDIRALVNEFVKKPVEVRLGQTAGKDVKLLAAPKALVHQ